MLTYVEFFVSKNGSRAQISYFTCFSVDSRTQKKRAADPFSNQHFISLMISFMAIFYSSNMIRHECLKKTNHGTSIAIVEYDKKGQS